MSVEVAIVCDGCAAHMVAAKTAKKAREELAQMGGKSRPPIDVCPDCVRKGIRP
jgi:serine/threonine protein phosphatase PrpC